MLHKLLNYTLKCNNADFIGVTRSFEGAKFELSVISSQFRVKMDPHQKLMAGPFYMLSLYLSNSI